MQNITDLPIHQNGHATEASATKRPRISKPEVTDTFSSVYRRDLFFDAVPVAIPNANEAGQRHLFGTDYLTPHKHKSDPELDPFADPVPLKFLKVMPGVVYEFRFRLTDSLIGGHEITAAKKETLLMQLLQMNGLGAKTNVGYGHFTDRETLAPSQASSYTANDRNQPGQPDRRTSPAQASPAPKPAFVEKHVDQVRRGDTVKGKLIRFDGGMAVLQLELDGFSDEVKTRNPRLGKEMTGKTFLLSITNKGGKKGKWSIDISFKSVAPLD